MDEAARRAGVDRSYFDMLVALGLVTPDRDGRFTSGQARQVQIVRTLDQAGIPIDGLAEAVKRGEASLDFVESKSYETFSALSDETFAEVSARTGVPFELLSVLREAMGLAPPSPEDRVRDDELRAVPFVATQVRLGFRAPAIERMLRVTGESMRRIADQEADWWRTEVIEPALQIGATGERLSAPLNDADQVELTTRASEQLLAIYNARQAHAWSTNIISGLEAELGRIGLFSRLKRPPAICFLDITGYTRLTEERGDHAAAQLAGDLGRLVQSVSVGRHGKPIKWLGDGVMLYFDDAGNAVAAALDMVEGVQTVGLPPAHVGIDAGPVLFQEGDYFGTTVNVASRIADYARPREVLVSQAVVDAAEGAASFDLIGPVELKGVRTALTLHVARRAKPSQ